MKYKNRSGRIISLNPEHPRTVYRLASGEIFEIKAEKKVQIKKKTELPRVEITEEEIIEVVDQEIKESRLEDKTAEELKTLAKEKGIARYWLLKRDTLIKKLS